MHSHIPLPSRVKCIPAGGGEHRPGCCHILKFDRSEPRLFELSPVLVRIWQVRALNLDGKRYGFRLVKRPESDKILDPDPSSDGQTVAAAGEEFGALRDVKDRQEI